LPLTADFLLCAAAVAHMIGDAVGSIGVMLSWAVVAFGGAWLGRWRFLADPLCSLGILAVILSTTLPILRQSSAILLNKAPAQLDVAALRRRILATPGVLDLHCLHVWNLTDDKVLGTCHVTASATAPAMGSICSTSSMHLDNGSASALSVMAAVREAMCRAGVHVTTVQVRPTVTTTSITDVNPTTPRFSQSRLALVIQAHDLAAPAADAKRRGRNSHSHASSSSPPPPSSSSSS
jgi:cation diffusion facilitator family transporter